MDNIDKCLDAIEAKQTNGDGGMNNECNFNSAQ